MRKLVCYLVLVCALIFSGCKKTCYECSLYNSKSEFCGDNARDLADIWVSTKKMEEIANINRAAASDDFKRREIAKISARTVDNSCKEK